MSWSNIGQYTAFFWGLVLATRLGWLFVNEGVSALWPNAGVGLAAFALLRWRALPLVIGGCLVGELWSSSSLTRGLMGTATNTLAPLLAWIVLERWQRFRPPVDGPARCLAWCIGGAVCGLVSSVLGILLLMGLQSFDHPLVTMRTWALSDAIAVWIVGSPILAAHALPEIRFRPWARPDWLAMVGLCLVAAHLAFDGLAGGGEYAWMQYLPVPVLMGMALRFGFSGAAIGSFFMGVATLWALLSGLGPGRRPNEDMTLMLQLSLAVPALTSLATGALIDDRNRKEQALVEAERAAQAANRSKSQFLANMSHEIRTPMNGIIGLTNLALANLPAGDVRDQLEGVRFSSESLLHLLNDILDSSKIEAGKLELAPVEFDLRATVSGVVAGLQQSADAKGLKISLEIDNNVPEWCYGDDLRLRQILFNLINNAIKFTHEGGVRVEVFGRGPGPAGALGVELVEFAVVDTGIGISETAIQRIFTAFEQADTSTTRKYGGTGLGLSIAMRLARMMGGGIRVESEVGRGSRFSCEIRLERRERPPAQAREPVESLSALPALKILVAEDNRVNSWLIASLLSAGGHAVTVASDGERAVEAALEGGFDCILMDVQMPELDGLEATRRLRGAGVRIPIYALTALAMEGDRENCEQAGMNGHLAKPIDLTQLHRALTEVASSRGLGVAYRDG